MPTITIYDCATGEQTVREMTEEENAVRIEALHNAEEEMKVREQERVDAQNGRQKLLDLGLSEEEVTALVGPPPPDAAPDVEAPDPA